MKCVNNGSQKISLSLPIGEVILKKGDIADLPEWLFKMLVNTYPELKQVQEQKVVTEPTKIVEPKVVKDGKGKKSGK